MPARVVLAALAAALILPASVSAATRTVTLSPPAKDGKAFQRVGADANAFFPSTTRVHVGDKTVFRNNGFHNIDIPRRGGRPQPLFVPMGTVSGATDAAGAPFWFNKLPSLQFNPAIAAPGGPTKATVNGSRSVVSHLPVAGPAKPLTITWGRTGTYRVYCDVHAGMTATVVVLGRRAKVPTPKADDRAAAKQAARALATAKRLVKTKVTGTTVDLGESGPGGVESFAMFPANLTVTAGTTVTFRMSPLSREVHTATFGPGDPESQPGSYLGKLAGSLTSPSIDPAALYASDPALVSLTPSLHGNGFWNSGVLDRAPKSTPPASNRVTFSQAGTYTYYCLIHPFMKGTVTVR